MTVDKKIPVGILGATGSVGQKFVELLTDHPWFEITELAASEKSAGRKYDDVVNWFLPSRIPASIGALSVKECRPGLNCKIVFSALDANAAGEIETEFANAGYVVVSNAKNHRYDKDVPLLIPDVNPDHLDIIKQQKFSGGMIITNPNCSTTGLAVALKPLHDAFGIEALNVVTMQALSGAGYPGVSSLDAMDNVIPFIKGEEEKMELEPLKILGAFNGTEIINADFKISASCNRVSVIDGHLESVSIKLKNPATESEIIDVLINYKSEPQRLKLPSAPLQPVHYFYEDDMPQPRLLRNLESGMAVSVGRLRKCNLFDYKFSVLSHNTIRGAAGGAILNAELLAAKGYLD
ncbi:MAG: aspartate-semialdehyde dehydrogenase [Melioribacteraceae bacterium]|nr:aspartate-semialdehyde dehydrogenase [Melioribacteraceae bacterium]MCF8395773.1 aspartate-semialdehyde dehydrogenase [Melioribacteraceae bacterium]MCF8420902.1 aspartate-semialdehyde dehydrogenase [Melioribacteraceae bacterium]